MNKTKIRVTENIVADAITKGKKVVDVMKEVYEGEIADRVKNDERLAELTPLELAMIDAGLSKKSLIKDFYTTSDNELLFPTIIDTRLAEIVAANPLLDYVVGSTQTVPGMSTNGLKLDWTSDTNKSALNKRDVAEGTDLPIVKVETGKRAISLHKRGVAVEATYETIAYCTLDLFMRTLNAIGANSANQQMGDVIDVLINGDGNDNAAETTTAAGTSFTTDDIVNFAVDFSTSNNGLNLDTIICSPEQAKALLKMTVANTVDEGYRLGKSFNFPQYDLKNITVIGDSRVPKVNSKDILIGLNKDNALTKYIAQGSQINEVAKNIRNQTKLGTLSEIVGFGKFIDKASMILKTK
jgi:hypothetical protein